MFSQRRTTLRRQLILFLILSPVHINHALNFLIRHKICINYISTIILIFSPAQRHRRIKIKRNVPSGKAPPFSIL